MKTLTDLTPTRIAVESDFRAPGGTLMLNLEYYERGLYDKIWQMQITDPATNKEWLKLKIKQGLIRVLLVPVFWNLKPGMGFETDEDCNEALDRLQKGESEVSTVMLCNALGLCSVDAKHTR